MTKTKYFTSGGIAFSEKGDLTRLKKFASKGWNVKGYKGMGYELEKGEPEEVDFSIDIHHLAEGDEDEYFAMFEYAGWEHVCTNNHTNTHLFKAPVGTEPIYSDKETKVEKLLRLQNSIMPAVWITVGFTIITYVLMLFSGGAMSAVFEVLFIIFLMLMVPCISMYIALTYRRLRLQ
ncbi:MAG: DUF2812 domain-containing protein [Solibacillus sp.]